MCSLLMPTTTTVVTRARIASTILLSCILRTSHDMIFFLFCSLSLNEIIMIFSRRILFC